MKTVLRVAFTLAFAVSARAQIASFSKHADPAPALPPAAPLEKAHPLELFTTQISAGMIEVAEKRDGLLGMSDDKADEWLRKHAVPVVKRGDRLYMIDHHHETRAAWEAGFKHVYTQVVADLSHLKDDADFWDEMKKREWVYLYDQYGVGPHSPDHLPRDVRGLADDPHRSLAGKVRDAGGYQKNTKPFSEFQWANFFRGKISRAEIYDALAQAVADAVALAKTAAAQGLPGWSGRP
jgi:hypothetical protein